MLEEETLKMDRKNNTRQSSAVQRSSNDTAGKNQNSGRRRGRVSNDGNNSFNDGQSRKPTPQKYKNNWDKRPRPRGDFSERPRGDLEEDLGAEYGSAIQSGSKKGSLNHLLNFTYTDDHDLGHVQGRGYRGAGPGGGAYSRGRQVRYRNSYSRHSKVFYNKELFLQANCQFVVKESGDYSSHILDPDVLVNWDAVEQVRVIGTEEPSCPICLQYPTAAKMTRCGHIYCWACILHYLALGEQTWRKCPICYESIVSQDLKSVVSRKVENYKAGDTITMTLMKKEKGSIYAVPADCWTKQTGKCHNVQETEEMTRHLKLLTATPEQVLSLLEIEKQELRIQLRESEASEEPFIKGAQDQVKSREELLVVSTGIQKEVEALEDAASKLVQSSDSDTPITVDTAPKTGAKNVKVYKSAFSDEEDDPIEEDTGVTTDTVETTQPDITHNDTICKTQMDITDTADDITQFKQSSSPLEVSPPPSNALDITANKTTLESVPSDFPVGSPDARPTPIEMIPDIMPLEEAAEHLELPQQPGTTDKTRHKSGDHSFYFYQAADGQHIYLHSLNARCLMREFGSLENCPQKITANIIEKESVFVTEELRKRLRYLSHLPLTCGFEVTELALKPPLVGKDTLKYFSDDIEKRRRQRQRKNREDKRRGRMIDEEERKKFGLDNGTIVRSQFYHPNQPSPSERMCDARSDTSSPSIDTPIGSPLGLNVNAGEFRPGTSPGEDDGHQTSTVSFAQMLKAGSQATVWPKKDGLMSPISPGTRHVDSDDSDNNQDKVPVPVFQRSFGSAIEAALDSIDTRKSEAETHKASTPGSGGKKKKKQLMLFSTSMARGGK